VPIEQGLRAYTYKGGEGFAPYALPLPLRFAFLLARFLLEREAFEVSTEAGDALALSLIHPGGNLFEGLDCASERFR
jgi:hypothetical protein